MERTALPRRLTWQFATEVELVDETPRCKSLVLDPPAWPGHRAGQHVDVRLTAEDGYQAERSYSIASAPEDSRLVLTVERLEDGEVSPYLTDEHPMTGAQRDPGPPSYEFRIRGHLGESTRGAFPGLAAEARDGNTVLRGTLPDQAALFGVLAQIEALGLELLEVRRLPPN